MKLSLTQSLLLLGAVVLLALLVHAWWSVRRAAPRQGEAAEPEQRVEPSLGEPPDPVAEAMTAAELPAQPTVAPVLRPVPVRRVVRLDALVDAIVPLTVEAPVAGEMALAHLPHSWRAGSKPMHIEGLNRDTEAWELPQAEQVYTEFQAGVQLANRKGPLNEIEYSEFVQKVQAFAEAVGAMADFPDMLEVVARARELDDFANPLDAQIGLNLRASDASWSVSFVQQCAAAHGFVLVIFISALGHISGGHFNPAVSTGLLITGKIKPVEWGAYVVTQLVGATLGVDEKQLSAPPPMAKAATASTKTTVRPSTATRSMSPRNTRSRRPTIR